jgi:hypothetical protein
LGLVASLAPAGRQPHAAGAPAAPPPLPDKPSILIDPTDRLVEILVHHYDLRSS